MADDLHPIARATWLRPNRLRAAFLTFGLPARTASRRSRYATARSALYSATARSTSSCVIERVAALVLGDPFGGDVEAPVVLGIALPCCVGSGGTTGAAAVTASRVLSAA